MKRKVIKLILIEFSNPAISNTLLDISLSFHCYKISNGKL